MIGVGAVLLVAGAIVVLASLAVLHVVPTGLRPWIDPVSQYGITRFRAGYLVAALGAAVAGVGGVLALAPLGAAAAVVLLVVFAVARAIIPFVPMDAPEAPRTRRGRAHNLLAIAAFASVTAAGFLAGGALHDAGYPNLANLSTGCAIVMAIGSAGVILGFFTPLRRVFGASERLIYLGFIAWFLMLGFGLFAAG